MRGVNKVILVGNIGHDPEVRTLQSGTPVANCSLATSSAWTDSSGQKNEKVEWHRLVMYSRLAEIAGQYLRKGSPIYVEGSLQTRKWEKDGKTMQSTEVIVRDMQMLGRRDDSSGSSVERPYQPEASHSPENTGFKPSPASGQTAPLDEFDDDIPF